MGVLGVHEMKLLLSGTLLCGAHVVIKNFILEFKKYDVD